MNTEPEAVSDGYWDYGQFFQVDSERRHLWRRLSLDELHDELDEIAGIAAYGGDLPQRPSAEWPFGFEDVIRFTSGSDGEEVWAWFRDCTISRSSRRRLLAEDAALKSRRT